MATAKLPHIEDYRRLGRAMRVLRLKAGLTQAQAGARVGMRAEFVSEHERAGRGLRWHTLLQFLKVYKSSLSELSALIEADKD
jgi:transcriptional regulator with XRE-family HTH domain